MASLPATYSTELGLARRVIGARSVRDVGQPLGQIQVTLRLTTYSTDSVSGHVKYALFLPYTTIPVVYRHTRWRTLFLRPEIRSTL